jgi:hypothetical protein
MDMEMETNMGSVSRGARRTIGTYSTYGEAQRAVDLLADHKFPVERVAIVAEGLKLVEQITGRLSYGRVAMNGALSGAVVGSLFGFMFGLFSWVAPLVSAFQLALYGIVYGSIIGALMSTIFYALTGGRRDFSSASGISAERYNVIADDEVADEAARYLRVLRGDSDRVGPMGSEIPQAV